MLKELGYDPNLNPPNYGVPDPEVTNNTKNLEINRYEKLKKR
jgi:protein-tyrosine sulfotransferase